MAYHEIEQRGTADFPFAYFHLDFEHSRYNMSAHWHAEFEIIRVLEGELHILLNNTSYIAGKGDIIFVNSETVHQGTPRGCVYECIVFHADFLHTERYDSHGFIKSLLDRECSVKEYFPCGDNEINRAINLIFDSLTAKGLAYKFRVISAFYQFFALVYEEKLYSRNIGGNTISTDKSIAKLKKILSFIRGNYDKPITLSEIASTVGMSPKYLGCFFKKMTERTPIEYLNEYRVERAAHKLRSTDMSVTDIAFCCGFSDLSYFIKTFKSIKGISPGKFKNT
ncbi:MAG: helix-turn-helix transcriptional regulator [Clostridia bacterium]|nr:helix-turn-helix transcriptional regulator [Clostridia bacterium]